MAKIVVALGGNALGKNPIEQKNIVKKTAKAIVKLYTEGNDVVVVHGNGPQVGMINNSFSLASESNTTVPKMPFPECGAMSQGYIGYHLQNAIKNELFHQGLCCNVNVVSLITQTLVDANDPGFKNPTKPIGAFYTEEVAKDLAKKNNWVVKEDSGRGWRRVVASPKAIDIVEKESIKQLLDTKTIVIACGGGGIPVTKDKENGKGYQGQAAVIDKDFASAKLAEIINADKFMILTGVDKVAINFNKPNQKSLDTITIEEAKKYIADNQFGAGSMLPKIEAAMQFVMSDKNKETIIASLDNADQALKGLSGTIIKN